MSRSYKEAEESFLQAKNPERKKSHKRQSRPVLAIEAVTKLKTVEYFNRILTDDMESMMWMIFITGKAPKLGEDNKPIIQENGTPILEDVELNPISWKAFEKAVEYKRGKPVVTLKGEDSDGKPAAIEISVIGATPQFFEEQAKSKGLLSRGV